MPQIRCSEGTGLTFNGSDNAQQMNVTLSGLLVNESFASVQDTSVNIDGCKFEGSKQGVEFVIGTKVVSSIQITNSIFSRNRKCISVTVNSTKSSSKNSHVVFKMTNSSFDANVLSDDGRCISFADNNQSVSCDINLKNITFSRNKFGSKGLFFLGMESGDQNIHLQEVTFNDNSPLSGRDVLTGDGDSECIIHTSLLKAVIKSSNFTSQHARLFNFRASNISLQIYNSRFFEHTVGGKGGVIILRGTDVCKLNVSTSSFVNTIAGQGGAINMECPKMYSVSFQKCIFKENKARLAAGGAIYIDAFGSVSYDAEYAANDKAHSEQNNSQRTECLREINITNCDFVKGKSFTRGGAVYIKAVNAAIRLSHSTFTNCTTLTVVEREEGGGGGGVFIYSDSSSSRRQKSRNHLLLIVESSRFTGCGSSGYDVDWPFSGSLSVNCDHTEISIKNSYFISNYAGYVIDAVAYGGAIYINCENARHITIEHSIFSNNIIFGGEGGAIYITGYQSAVILQNVTMESNGPRVHGGAVAIRSVISTVKIQQSRFLKNIALVIFISNLNLLEVQDSLFDSNGGGLYIDCSYSSSKFTSIVIFNTTFKNCSSTHGGGAIYLSHTGNVSMEVRQSQFVESLASTQFGYGGAICLSLASDIVKNPGCIHELSSTGNQIYDTVQYPSWAYRSHVIFKDTIFQRNAGYGGGAVYLTNGKVTFRNCSFTDNIAATVGGHLYTVSGSASLNIVNSRFRQTRGMRLVILDRLRKIYTSKASFIHAESSGNLIVYNTTMDVSPYGSTSSLLSVRYGRLIDLGNKNWTTLTCPLGSQMKITNFTDIVLTHINNTPCKIEVTILEFTCSACKGNTYSLQRGRAFGSQLAPGFQCLPCPFGANCSHNIFAKPNFWGFNDTVNPPTLKFVVCPVGYCRPPETTEFPEYNACQDNRSGELCGQCNDSYTETLYSTRCRPSLHCKDYWFWPVALVYVSLMAFYFIFNPPIVPWIKRQILWFKNHDQAREHNNFDKGYIKVIFYFYQVANLLIVSNSSQHIFRTKFIDPLVGLFNFQQEFSSRGLICPFPGLTVVTKQLFSASHVLGTLIMTGVFYMLHWGVHKCRGQGPSVGPYIGGVLQTMLLGYTTLASVSFNLLRCVPVGSEKRLFYNGNIVCFQWWQYILIAFICTFFVPFVFTLLWGSFKLYKKHISMGTFLLACSFPLPYLLYWTFVAVFFRARNAGTVDEDSPINQVPKSSVERVLYDSFKKPGDGGKLSLSWESVMIGRRLILIVLKAFVSDPMPRLLVMSFFCVLFLLHHALTQPFRDGIVNIVETVSLLSIVLLGMINVFFASFLSLAVPLSLLVEYLSRCGNCHSLRCSCRFWSPCGRCCFIAGVSANCCSLSFPD